MQKHEKKGVEGGATGEVVENKGARVQEEAPLVRQARMTADDHAQDYHEGIGRVL
jgi:hypothetical protein